MARIIEFEGRRIEVPDDATDDEIRGILSAPAPKPTVTPFGPTSVQSTGKMVADAPPETAADRAYAAMPTGQKVAHTGKALAQAGLRGMADLAGAPVDLPIGIFNLTQLGLNKAGSTFFDIPEQDTYIPFSLSDTIANTASDLATAAGAPPFTPEEMTSTENALFNPTRFATGSGAGGAMLASRAPGMISRLEANPMDRRVGDLFVRQYADGPATTVAGDVASGFGSGVGLDIAEEQAPDSPTAGLMAMLLGGTGGVTAANIAKSPATAAGYMASRMPDPNVPVNPTTFLPFSKRETEAAARPLQDATTRPAGPGQPAVKPGGVATQIRMNQADLAADGVQPQQMPTSGMLSRDPGLVTLEASARTQDGVPFKVRDENIKEAAASKVSGLRDPSADQSAVQRAIPARQQQLRQERDAEALPFLQQAEASGAVVDPQPVVDIIDSKLATAKRPPVRAALTEARKMLNVVGSDDLDTSVAGLYEARKAINDVIEGRGENATGRFAQKELIEVRTALDDAITAASPEFGEYLTKFREGSEPLDDFGKGTVSEKLKVEDPRDVAESLLGGKWGAEKTTDDINKLVGTDDAAKAGFKAAVSDVLYRRVSGTKNAGNEPFETTYAKLTNEFKNNEGVLSKVYGPEEMSTLRQAHKLLSYFKEAEKRATVGSNTADKFWDSVIGKGVQLGVRQIYGDLKGGGIVRRFKLMLSTLPNNQQNVQELMRMAWFDPQVAAYLLDRPVRKFEAAPYNVNLKRAMALDENFANSDEETTDE